MICAVDDVANSRLSIEISFHNSMFLKGIGYLNLLFFDKEIFKSLEQLKYLKILLETEYFINNNIALHKTFNVVGLVL